ncbi:hypothetical protein BD324DRAFT_623938 [Kockovaella imperatae]|uniref:Manganese/iron superoxide dismutase C-terminal domain-containing protein n=1 Tax=Kockovaella imperatae TaxID=4999 RepID=A0A1Y1UIZ0_9TREE|nr:hypothetical protein BD324DRAFT_623938 [Kockovaella imperatae]ORX37952.1 hypothetical protein BD324DRAFT_623938 [Kockovaella imperatae]
MSRASSSTLRSLAVSSSSRIYAAPTCLPRRSFASQAKPMSGQVSSVDKRVLEGVDGFIPQRNMEVICDWQRGLWSRLQEEVRNNPELLEVKQKWDKSGLDMTYMVSQTAKNQSTALAYNWSALLLNNSFFLENINAYEPQEVPHMYEPLLDKVSAYADGIVGGCWLWLVKAGDKSYDVDIVPTFGSGTFLVSNRAQRGREDLPVFGTPYNSTDTEGAARRDDRPAQAGLGAGSAPNRSVNTNRLMSGGVDYTSFPAPLAVLNLFEHAYLGNKYGVWSRAAYARDWWKTLDWNKIQQRAGRYGGAGF